MSKKSKVEAVRSEIEDANEDFTLKAIDFALTTHMQKKALKLKL